MKLKLTPVKDLTAKKPAEIEKYITELKKQQVELTHQITLGKEKQTHQISQLKRAVAQAHTVLTQTAKGKE